jgi:hypothetical protein
LEKNLENSPHESNGIETATGNSVILRGGRKGMGYRKEPLAAQLRHHLWDLRQRIVTGFDFSRICKLDMICR